jgi:mannitol 2-dehydrogenase
MAVEVSPLLPQAPGLDLEDYRRTLLERFANPAIKDQLSRIGTEASVRMPKFVLPSIVEQTVRGGPLGMLSFAVACWFRCLAGVDDHGRTIVLADSMAERLGDLARCGGPDPTPLICESGLFGHILPRSRVFLDEVSRALRDLCDKGARASLASRHFS